MIDLHRLIPVLKLLTSDKDGEVLAAAAAVNRMLTTAGTSWDEVILFEPMRPRPHGTDQEMLRQAQSRGARLNSWEALYCTPYRV